MFKMKTPRSWRLRKVGTLIAPEGFGTLASVDATLDGVVAIWTGAGGREALEGREQASNGVTFARTRISGVEAAIASYTVDDLVPANVVRVEVKTAFPSVQPLPDGGYVIAGARCAWRPEGPEQNAMIVDAAGNVVRWGTLGDGISHLQTDRAGNIWTGYFDEGVYGNFGWRPPKGPDPVGARGLVRWSTELAKVWELPPDAPAFIDDCYALNVTDDRVLACTYSDFPVIQVHDEFVTVAPTEGIVGPRALATDGEHVAVVGGYGGSRAVTVGRLNGSAFRAVARGRLSAPGGARVMGRGSVLSGVVGARWYRADLAELLDRSYQR